MTDSDFKNICKTLNSHDFSVLNANLNHQTYKSKLTQYNRRKFISKIKHSREKENVYVSETLIDSLISLIVSMQVKYISKNTFIFDDNFSSDSLEHKSNDFLIYLDQTVINEITILLNEDVNCYFNAFTNISCSSLQTFVKNFIQHKKIKMRMCTKYLFDNFDYYFTLEKKNFIISKQIKNKMLIAKRRVMQQQSIDVVYQSMNLPNKSGLLEYTLHNKTLDRGITCNFFLIP